MRYFALALLAVAIIVCFASMNRAEAKSMEVKPEKPKIQIAILLDTSGSMQGLIDQAKQQLWSIVNEFAKSKQKGITPTLEVALYEYGKDSISADEHHLKQILPLTTDLDKVSEELFKLRTNGGSEYCGQVIHDAIKNLSWSEKKSDLRLVYIAGNEPFTQGNYKYQEACKEAVGKNVIVNTIHCGNHDQGVTGKWEDGAKLGKGKFLNIDHNRQIQEIKTPYDDKLVELSGKINKTYIGYGKKAEAARMRQSSADMNAKKTSVANAAERAEAKGGKLYENSSWDLVDKVKGGADLEAIEEEALPEEMQKMNKTEREKFVKNKAEERVKIQNEINELSKKRRAFITKEREKMAKEEGKPTLDQAMMEAARDQAEANDFSFEN